MPDRIYLLPDSVANQIAAGEVIQRPASVIKELVENAVDAGADCIRIFVRDAGRTLIQVIDNGHGMSDTDARMAFERHATSKISSADDLSRLVTMGFRGEALPSICAISQVEVRSRQPESAMGTHLVISGSRVEKQEPDVCEAGTNIMVKNIFFNVPARRKFLKSDSVELSNIMREFERLALVNPGVRMSIDTGGKTIDLRKGNLRQRIGDIWKGNLVEQLLPVEADTPTVKISGYITRPEFARRRNALQYFLVNGRNMRHPYFRKAVLNCFNGLIAPDSMPCYFIRFDIDPAAIDVNIHPTKDEIKFEDEAVIWSVLSGAVRASLGKNAAVPTIDFDTEHLPVDVVAPATDPGTPADLPAYDIPTDYNPFASATSASAGTGGADRQRTPGEHHSNPSTNWERLYEGFMKGAEKPQLTERPESIPELTDGQETAVGETLQFEDKYIIGVVEGRGVAVIDQYRAHLKILYEQLCARMGSGQTLSQQLLFPALLELSPEQEAPLAEVRETLHRLGLVLEKEGPDFVITGTPPGVTADEAVEIVMRVIESVSDEASHYGTESTEEAAERLRRDVTLAMAGSMAVKRGRALTEEERRKIVIDLFALPDPSLTPSGRRVYTLLDENAIRRLLP
ncbi:MAG: DNA mismatch repair endonuclease MutL [Muribaculaceae bacterium]|nr:DNA mismatch repair endonuclease MutL [Muribaculaceae bacterium]